LRIDSHQHFTPEYSPDLLYPILKRNRFDATVCFSGVGLPAYTSEHDFIGAVVIKADLASPDLPHLLDQLQLHPKFRGVYSEFPADPGLHELARRDLTLDLPPRPDLIPPIADCFPTLRVVLDHVGRPSLMSQPFDEWARSLEVAAQHPGLHAKISGLITDAPTRWHADQFRPAVHHALRTFGPDRVMYGSDWPSYLPEGTWKEALAAFTQSCGALPTEVRDQLIGETAGRFYRIVV
jgi:L-fuconolactonase